MADGRYRDVIDSLRSSERLPDGPNDACTICQDGEIGLAFDRANMPDSAIAVYEHFIGTPVPGRLDLDAWDLPRISRRLGELYEAKGEFAKAAAYYQKFVTLWKDADPDRQPLVTEIRNRLVRLRDVEPRKG